MKKQLAVCPTVGRQPEFELCVSVVTDGILVWSGRGRGHRRPKYPPKPESFKKDFRIQTAQASHNREVQAGLTETW